MKKHFFFLLLADFTFITLETPEHQKTHETSQRQKGAQK